MLLWNNFLALEKRLIDSFYYVEYTKENHHTYSLAYRSIILETCAEIEFSFKEILILKKTRMEEIYKALKQNNKLDFLRIIIEIPSQKMGIEPWETWTEKEPPVFWKAYNVIKHSGEINKATLENATNALAALFANLLAYYLGKIGKNFSENKAFKLPQFFSYKNLEPHHLVLENSNNINIPGFSN